MKPSQAKAQVLGTYRFNTLRIVVIIIILFIIEILEKWPLFGSSFLAIRRDSDSTERSEHILALNRNGVHFLDIITHVSLLKHNLKCYLYYILYILSGDFDALFVFGGDIDP